MERERTKLVEEDNTIYEIDLDCMRRKKMEQERKNIQKVSLESRNPRDRE